MVVTESESTKLCQMLGLIGLSKYCENLGVLLQKLGLNIDIFGSSAKFGGSKGICQYRHWCFEIRGPKIVSWQ